MSYWLPPALAVPRNTSDTLARGRALAVADCALDRAAAWMLARRFWLYTQGDPYTLSEAEWNAVRYVEETYRSRPAWMDPPSSNTPPRPTLEHRRAYSAAGWSGFLPTRRLSPRFSLVALPFLRAEVLPFAGEAIKGVCFLIARHEGERVRLYPRSLHSPHAFATCASVLSARALPRLLPLWEQAFDALPAYATCAQDIRAGLPTLAASIKTKPYPSMGEDTHPYWVAAKHATCAALSLLHITPTPPPTGYALFHWSVHSGAQSYQEREATYAPLPLRVAGLSHDGWSLRDSAPPPPGVGERLHAAAQALGHTLTTHAPTEPLFFDTLAFAEYGIRTRISSDMAATGLHLPWMDKAMLAGVGSTHAAMAHLSRLPPGWADTLTTALRPALAAQASL